MIELLDWRYVRSQRDSIQLTANLDAGWKYLESKGKKPSYWGFDQTVYIPNRSEPDYWCHLYVVALGPTTRESVQRFPGANLECGLGCNSVRISLSKMEVTVPLIHNRWLPTNESNRIGIYAIEDPLFSLDAPDGELRFRAQLWFVYHGPKSMFVKHQYEWGDGFAWVGGRPESNRRKF
jgi:hypothetical protein